MSGRITDDSRACGHVTCYDAPAADDGVIPDGDARQDEGAAPDLDVAANADRAAKLKHRSTLRRVARMIRGENLHTRPDLGQVADGHLDDVKNDATEIEEYALAKSYIVAVVTLEWRADVRTFADLGEQLRKHLVSLGL